MRDQQKVIEAVKQLLPEAGNIRVSNYHPEFLKGSLYLLNFDGQESTSHCFVYVEHGETTVCKNQALLNELVARKSKKVGFAAVLESLGGIAGIIGLTITLTIVYVVVFSPNKEIPQILSTALTAILGFYFGTKSTK